MSELLDLVFDVSQTFLRARNQSYRRYFIQRTILNERFSLLIGQRGVGKTTLLIQYLLDHANNNLLSSKILYVPVDHIALGSLTLYDIAKQFNLVGGEFIAFDEIHKYSNWSAELKSIYDTFPELKIIASGSSALEIHKGSHDLSRRSIIYRVSGLSFREYLELLFSIKLSSFSLHDLLNHSLQYTYEIISVLAPFKNKILPLFHQYLVHGFYPYYFELQDEEKFKITLEQNVHTTLEADLSAIYPALTGISIKKIKQLLTFIGESVPFTPKWLNLKKILEIGDERTLKTYFKYLEDAELILTLYKSSKKLSAITSPEKIYLNNPNLAHVISMGNENIGTVRETFFLNMLSKLHSVTLPLQGDFLVDKEIIFEVGGEKKNIKQIYNHHAAYLACDNIETGTSNKIPLWLFGFLY
jgi:predicted AAA+ superfamily ATPase